MRSFPETDIDPDNVCNRRLISFPCPADRRFMETEEARERRDEEIEEKRKKEAGASKLTSKAESNSYAGFNTLLYTWPRQFQKLLEGIVLYLVIFTKTTLICQISSAQNFCYWNTLNIRVGERNTPDTLYAINRGIYSCTRRE